MCGGDDGSSVEAVVRDGYDEGQESYCLCSSTEEDDEQIDGYWTDVDI